MRDAMAYRGPDASGLSHGPGYALGHRRLSIIDLSDNGKQPMYNEDGSIEIVLNGEIYNFADLRSELVSKGHRFQSRTDTEVLVHGYEEWGLEQLLGRIRGMYAFAILDHNSHELHAARDPVGKKPFFFYFADGEMVFASSARALILGLRNKPEIEPRAIDHLLSYLYIPGPETILQDVEKLQPGHALTIKRDGTMADLVHWKPDFLHPNAGLTNEEWLEKTEEALANAVRRRLVADVPVGILLSGGIDSSLVTSMAGRLAGDIRTFAVATDDSALDESRFASAVAERCGTVHQVLKVDGNSRAQLTSLVAAMGEPLADASAVNTYAISEKAREFVTVVLTGDGGDEAFGGYSQYLAYYYAGELGKFIPRPLDPLFALTSAALLKCPGIIHRAGTLLRLATMPVEDTLFSDAYLGPEHRDALYTPEFREALGTNNAREHYLLALPHDVHAQPVDRVMQACMATVLSNDYLMKVDNGTMAVGLEARSPFLDIDLLELAMSVPVNIRFRGGKSKHLLRELALKYVPKECVNRRKQGFVAPVGAWLRQWSDLVDDLILGPHVEQRGWFRRPALESIVSEHRRGADRAYLLWGLLILELWVRMSLERTISACDKLQAPTKVLSAMGK